MANVGTEAVIEAVIAATIVVVVEKVVEKVVIEAVIGAFRPQISGGPPKEWWGKCGDLHTD